FFFFNPTPPTSIYTLSLHDALPICRKRNAGGRLHGMGAKSNLTQETERRNLESYRSAGTGRTPIPFSGGWPVARRSGMRLDFARSEEHTSELQSRGHLVCRLLLEKK